MTYVKVTDKNKPWAKKSDIKRDTIERKVIHQIFAIYCEGQNTEPEYFKSFPVTSETRVQAIGTGRSRLSLVTHVISLATKSEILVGQKHYDPQRQIWCVFDKDTKGENGEDEDFNQAIDLAESNGLLVAYSNDAFELWFLLHEKYIDVKQTRHQYYQHLTKKFGFNYEKKGKDLDFAKSLYEIFLSSQKIAIRNAEALYKSHTDTPHCKKNPCTTVFKLVIELNKYIKK